MKPFRILILLLPLLSAGCWVEKTVKAEKTLSNIDKKETKIDEELAEEKKGIDRLSAEIDELKKDTAK